MAMGTGSQDRIWPGLMRQYAAEFRPPPGYLLRTTDNDLVIGWSSDIDKPNCGRCYDSDDNEEQLFTDFDLKLSVYRRIQATFPSNLMPASTPMEQVLLTWDSVPFLMTMAKMVSSRRPTYVIFNATLYAQRRI